MLFEPVALMRFKFSSSVRCGRWKFVKDDLFIVKSFGELPVSPEDSITAYGLKLDELLISNNPLANGEVVPHLNVKAYLDLVEPKEWKGVYTALTIENGKTVIKSITQPAVSQDDGCSKTYNGSGDNSSIAQGTWTTTWNYNQMQQLAQHQQQRLYEQVRYYYNNQYDGH